MSTLLDRLQARVQRIHVDLAISKYITKEFSVELLAGYYDQVSRDSGEGNRVGPSWMVCR